MEKKKSGRLTELLQSDPAVRKVKIALIVLCLLAAAVFLGAGLKTISSPFPEYVFSNTETFIRTTDQGEEGYENETVCPVDFENADGSLTLTVDYPFEEWEELPGFVETQGFVYRAPDGSALAFGKEVSAEEIAAAVQDLRADEVGGVFGLAMALFLIAVGVFVITAFASSFTAYEQIWYVSILVMAAVFSLLFPESDANGVNGLVIMALYLLDTVLNISCELLISKQSKWNFIVSVFVEITEIVICVVLMYRFATMATTLFFWLPIDIISFINWHRHPDKQEEELTEVRSLTGLQEVLVVLAIVLWTVVVGWFLSGLDIATDFFNGNESLETLVIYLDACASAVGVANGVFILLRYREQWIAWYISSFLEMAINVISGQWALLPLKIGYLTNTTYGYIKWTRYIRSHRKEEGNGLPGEDNGSPVPES